MSAGLPQPATTAGCSAAVLSWNSATPNTDIVTNQPSVWCVVASGLIPPSLPQPSKVVTSRCWYSTLAAAQQVCEAYAHRCCGVSYDNVAPGYYEPRGSSVAGSCSLGVSSGLSSWLPVVGETCTPVLAFAASGS